MRTPQEAMTLAEELQQLRAENKKRAKKIARLKELNEFLEEASAFSRRAVGSREKRTIKVHSEKDRRRVVKGKISFYCEALKVSQQAFYDYLGNRNKPWKHERIAGLISDIIAEDECNDTYGRGRIYASLKLQYPRTHGISGNGDHRCGPSEKPKAKRSNQSEVRKSDDLLKRNFTAERSCKSVSQTLRKSPRRMANFMFRQFLTVMIYLLRDLRWRIICVLNFVFKRLITFAKASEIYVA